MRLFVAVVMFVMSSWVFAAEDLPRPTPSIEEAKPKIEEAQLDKAKTGENQPVVGAVEVKPVVGQHNADYKTNNQKTDPDKSVDYQWWFNLFLVILMGGLVITGALQVRVYREQARYMCEGLEVTRQSVKAGQDSANAATKSAEVAEKALRLTQRASLFAEGWALQYTDRGVVVALGCTLRNTGHVPASVGVGSLNFVRSPELSPMPDRLKLPPTREGPFTVTAQGALKYLFPITPEQWKEMCPPPRSREVLYFYGYIMYADDFDGGRYVLFCVYCQNPIGPVTPVFEPGYNYST